MTLAHAKEIRGILTEQWLEAVYRRDAESAMQINEQLLDWEGIVRRLQSPKP